MLCWLSCSSLPCVSPLDSTPQFSHAGLQGHLVSAQTGCPIPHHIRFPFPHDKFPFEALCLIENLFKTVLTYRRISNDFCERKMVDFHSFPFKRLIWSHRNQLISCQFSSGAISIVLHSFHRSSEPRHLAFTSEEPDSLQNKGCYSKKIYCV